MEKSADNLKKGEEENAAVGGMREPDEEELPQNKEKKVEQEKTSPASQKKHSPSYMKLAANMQDLRMNLENHLRVLQAQNSAVDAEESASCSAKNANDNSEDFTAKVVMNEMSTAKEKISQEKYVLSFEQLAANAKVLTDNEISEFAENPKQNADAERKSFNKHKNKASSAANYSSKVNSDVEESGVNVNTEDLVNENLEMGNDEDKDTDDMEGEARNAIEVLGQMGFGFYNLNDELPAEYDQGAMRKFLKNVHNTLIKNKFTANKSHEY